MALLDRYDFDPLAEEFRRHLSTAWRARAAREGVSVRIDREERDSLGGLHMAFLHPAKPAVETFFPFGETDAGVVTRQVRELIAYAEALWWPTRWRARFGPDARLQPTPSQGWVLPHMAATDPLRRPRDFRIGRRRK